MAIKRKGARRLPQMSFAPPASPNAPSSVQTPDTQQNQPALYTSVWMEIKELLRRVWQLENQGGGGTSMSITATSPIVVAPTPLTDVGVVSHANSGVTAATYGSATKSAVVTVNATGHVTGVTEATITGGASAGNAIIIAKVFGRM